MWLRKLCNRCKTNFSFESVDDGKIPFQELLRILEHMKELKFLCWSQAHLNVQYIVANIFTTMSQIKHSGLGEVRHLARITNLLSCEAGFPLTLVQLCNLCAYPCWTNPAVLQHHPWRRFLHVCPQAYKLLGSAVTNITSCGEDMSQT